MKVDWNEMWKSTEGTKDRTDNLEFWNSFAPRFRKKVGQPDPYIERFYEYMNPEPEDTLFDMGCGSGTLAIPFAEKGHDVYAADFSSEMLKYLMEGAKEAGVEGRIHPIELNWNEDWSSRYLPVCDIAFSSRSLIAEDLTQALKNLEAVASRKICMGVWDTPVTDYDRYVAKAIGYERPGMGAHFMVIGELLDRDVLPEVKNIYTPFRLTKYKTQEEAAERIRNSFTHITGEQEILLAEYLRDHLVYHDEETEYHGKPMKDYWQLDHDDMSTMAFISWEKRNI